MPSLMECVVTELEDQQFSTKGETAIAAEELLAQYDLDAIAISSVPGAWEPVEITDRTQPHVDDLPDDVFKEDGPSVYECDSNFMVVRGREEAHFVYFVYSRSL